MKPPANPPTPPTRSPTRSMVGVVMGSRSDWEIMTHAAETLDSFAVPFEVRVLSAHRTPDALLEWASTAEARGLAVIIAAAGGAAHLAGVTAAKTVLPVLGVPMESAALKGMDSLLSTVQMPAGIPVATFAIGRAGATNAALFAVAILATHDRRLRDALHRFRKEQSAKVLAVGDPRSSPTESAQAGRRNRSK
ncbi:MAG TPA: 5-(carboxyamino)imidazole ribonucleotide mutase [Pseudomonadales bacterium]|nr:5-(carboxyamino)imidazole ribonucleotide mutase [Pseudomonadales bacterium]